jgi:hypothetical protein
MFDFLQGVKINIAVAGVSAVLAVMIVCMTALALHDKEIPALFYMISGTLGFAMAAVSLRGGSE